MHVRAAILSDIPWLVEQLREMHGITGEALGLFDEEHVRKSLPNLIGNHVFLVSEEQPGGPCGFICGMILPHYLWPSIVTLTELVWWVAQAKRFSRAAVALLEEYIAVGRKYVKWITMTIARFTPIKPESFLRRGFVLRDQTFVLEVV